MLWLRCDNKTFLHTIIMNVPHLWLVDLVLMLTTLMVRTVMRMMLMMNS